LPSPADSARIGPAVPDPVDSDAKLQLVIAEYQSVAGLIQYFREVELKALAGAGLVLSVVGAAYAALAAENATKHDQAVLLVIAAWVPAVSLLVVLMATLRGFRAVVYMHDRVNPLAKELTGDCRFLAYEVHADDLFDTALGKRKWHRVIAPRLVPGVAVLLLIASASLLLAVLGCVIWPDLLTLLIGGIAALLAVGLAVIGVKLTRLRHGYPDAEPRILVNVEGEDARRLERIATERGKKPGDVVADLLRDADDPAL
jgi:cytochrome bd-type quinol oxidase subunit 2